MKIELITIGKTTEKFLKEGIDKYTDRLGRYVHFSILELPDIKVNIKPALLQKKEEALIRKKIKADDFIILLDEKGQHFNSLNFSQHIEAFQATNVKKLVFIIGGAYGFSKELHERANAKIALSRMTFTHEMARLFFIEQLYRAFTIIKKHPYHNA